MLQDHTQQGGGITKPALQCLGGQTGSLRQSTMARLKWNNVCCYLPNSQAPLHRESASREIMQRKMRHSHMLQLLPEMGGPCRRWNLTA